MSQESPFISVVMTVFNDGPFVCEAVTSILRQTFKDFEFIIVDDGAIDDSVQKVLEFKDTRIRLIRQLNAGLASALNKGILEARGKYIARQDADDISAPDRLELLVRFLDEHPEVGLVGCNALLIDESGHVFSATEHPLDNESIQKALIEKEENPFVHGSVVFRKWIALKAGLYRTEFRQCQDMDLWLRMAEITQLANIQSSCYSWRFRKGSIGTSYRIDKNNYVRLALWCARNRRNGQPEPELSLVGITRDWSVKANRLRTVDDPNRAYDFSLAQTLFIEGYRSHARSTFFRVATEYPFNLYAWFLLGLSLLPQSMSRFFWKGAQKIYRFGTWKR
jgi:glycosyltransferase involved in cell wall biosynthesis